MSVILFLHGASWIQITLQVPTSIAACRRPSSVPHSTAGALLPDTRNRDLFLPSKITNCQEIPKSSKVNGGLGLNISSIMVTQ